MAIKHIKPGQDFSYPTEFGFSGSAQGRHDPRTHPNQDQGEYGDGLAYGGQPKTNYQAGGGTILPGSPNPALPGARTGMPPTPAPAGGQQMVPASLAANAAKGAAALGAAKAARALRGNKRPMPAAQGRPMPMGAPAPMAHGGPLNAKTRNALASSSFALPGRRYPINDPNHARNALARVSQHGSPEEKSLVRSAVHRKFPSIGKGK